MKAIILCAGYATRLYPMTLNKPKPLLEIKGRPMLDHIVGKIEKVDCVDEMFIVANNRFYNDFLKWKNCGLSKKVLKSLTTEQIPTTTASAE
ncbi:NTP transferase domain-containing protein [Candidatus Pacearchaeota archaeon]|nr:NTP transferase domain-containing protein [Candidatus Pacearchaeota archaeon]